MKKLVIPNFKMPDLYVCEDVEDAELAREHGIPYVIRPSGVPDETLVFILLRNSLKKMFPMIDWDRFADERFVGHDTDIRVVSGYVPPKDEKPRSIGKTRTMKIGDDGVADIATGERVILEGFETDDSTYTKLDEWLGDKSASVDIDMLMDLELLPAFCIDVTKAIRKNLAGYDWTDGYNKKLDMCNGTYSCSRDPRNLLIIDISHSIPRGISATMLMLASTLRDRLNADLIVTGAITMIWKLGEDLPSPQWIRDHIGMSNETQKFARILAELGGTEYGNVIAFGDYDSPSQMYIENAFKEHKASPIIVHNVMSFHTMAQCTKRYKELVVARNELPLVGYVKWVAYGEHICTLAPGHRIEKDYKWCNLIM